MFQKTEPGNAVTVSAVCPAAVHYHKTNGGMSYDKKRNCSEAAC